MGRKTLTLKRFGIMINLEYIEQVKFKENKKIFFFLKFDLDCLSIKFT